MPGPLLLQSFTAIMIWMSKLWVRWQKNLQAETSSQACGVPREVPLQSFWAIAMAKF